MFLRHSYENTPDIWLAEEGRWHVHLHENIINDQNDEFYTETKCANGQEGIVIHFFCIFNGLLGFLRSWSYVCR